MHLVSNVEGRLAPGWTPSMSARELSAGTVTGAHKVRAMQIIDELEPVEARHLQRRGGLPRLMATWTWRSPSAPRC